MNAPLTPELRQKLLEIAKASIRHGYEHHVALKPDLAALPPEFREPRATFVTLKLRDELQGCIGTLRSVNPLAEDIAHNAYAAAFDDPRALALSSSDIDKIHIHISILSPSEPLPYTSEQDLISKLRPGVDGLILEDTGHRGTFLPSVWESLPDPRDFLRQLKFKAGLPTSYWSNNIKISRYITETFSD